MRRVCATWNDGHAGSGQTMNNLSVQVCKGVRAFSRQRRLSSRRGLAVELKDLPAWSAASAETGRSERATHPFDPDDYALLKAIHRSPFQINVALGASSGNILGLVSYQALGMVAAGVALELAGSIASLPWIGHLLYGVPAADARALSASALFVAWIAASATAIPAVRAVRIEPGTALRQEG